MYAQIAFGLLALYGGYMGANAKKEGATANADEYDILAAQTNIDKHWNAYQRNYMTEQVKLNQLASGIKKAGMAGLIGQKTIGGMEAEGGASGAMLGVGTTNEKIVNQHIQNSSQQLAIMQETNEKLTNIQQNAVAVNKMEDYKAEQRIAQLTRAANSIRAGADSAFYAGMIGAFSNAGSAYLASGGDFKDEPGTGLWDMWFTT